MPAISRLGAAASAQMVLGYDADADGLITTDGLNTGFCEGGVFTDRDADMAAYDADADAMLTSYGGKWEMTV